MMFTTVDKAIVSLLYSVAFLGDNFGVFTIPAEYLTTLAAALPAIVWLIPNKRKA